MNFSSDKVEKVLDLIYDAAADNDLWPHALTAVADLTHSEGASCSVNPIPRNAFTSISTAA